MMLAGTVLERGGGRVVGGKMAGRRTLKEVGAKTQTQTTEEESELLVIISIPVDMKLYPSCGKPRKATAK